MKAHIKHVRGCNCEAWPFCGHAPASDNKTPAAADLHEWIAKACRFDKDSAGCDDIKEDRYRLRDEGRNPDGSGESYAERNQ